MKIVFTVIPIFLYYFSFSQTSYLGFHFGLNKASMAEPLKKEYIQSFGENITVENAIYFSSNIIRFRAGLNYTRLANKNFSFRAELNYFQDWHHRERRNIIIRSSQGNLGIPVTNFDRMMQYWEIPVFFEITVCEGKVACQLFGGTSIQFLQNAKYQKYINDMPNEIVNATDDFHRLNYALQFGAAGTLQISPLLHFQLRLAYTTQILDLQNIKTSLAELKARSVYFTLGIQKDIGKCEN